MIFYIIFTHYKTIIFYHLEIFCCKVLFPVKGNIVALDDKILLIFYCRFIISRTIGHKYAVNSISSLTGVSSVFPLRINLIFKWSMVKKGYLYFPTNYSPLYITFQLYKPNVVLFIACKSFYLRSTNSITFLLYHCPHYNESTLLLNLLQNPITISLR